MNPQIQIASSTGKLDLEASLDELMEIISSSCFKGVDKAEDHCLRVKAVIGDLEIQNLHTDTLKALAGNILFASELSSYFDSQLKRLPPRSWRRWGLERDKRRRIKSISSALEKIRSTGEWKGLESSALDAIKTANGSTGSEGTNTLPGREGDMDNIMKLLLDPCSESVEHVPVVSIFGVEGLGKSKLARAIFDNGLIVDRFKPLRFWVNVGEEFDEKSVLEKLLECVLGDRTEDLPLDALKGLLQQSIAGKKFLLVLDDLLNEGKEEGDGFTRKWKELNKCLEPGGDGSRIVVVTRNESVADVISSLQKYVLEGLSVDESSSLWDFDVPAEVQPQEFERIKKEIVSRCGHNPLSSEVMGKVVRYRRRGPDLLNFMKEIRDKLDGTSTSALKLGYAFLPPQLQKCFLYCGLFPKGEDIDVQSLIHQWMAHQYIIRPEGAEESLEEIGLEYFKYLVKRSFLIEGIEDELGNIRTCKLDDSMHDLATKHVDDPGHKVVKELKNKEKMKRLDSTRTRHMSLPFHFNSKLTDECPFVARRLHTFLLPRQDILKSNEGQFRNSFSRDMLSKFKHLYVCDLHSSGLAKVPSRIRNLDCLRYLDLSDNDEIRSLPDAITRLRYLQVLNVAGCEMLEELPRNIRRLTDLRHLYCHRCWNLKFMPSGIGALTELRTLSWFVVAEDSSLFAHIGGLEELGGLHNLREVEIRNLKHLRGGRRECRRAKMTEKKHLQSLTLRWSYDEDDAEDKVADVKEFDLDLQLHEDLKRLKLRDYKGLTFPLRFTSLVNLVHISLKNCARCRTIPPLEHIETLKFLSVANFPSLLYIEYKEDNRKSDAALFKSLIKLSLSNCPNLKGWSTEEREKANQNVLGIEYFPSVLLAEIKDCTKFKPEFPKAEDKPATGNSGLDKRQLSHMLLQNAKHRKRHIRRTEAIIRDMVQHDPENAKTLTKWGTSVIVQDVESFPEELLENMSSFQKLHIKNCPKLQSLPEALKHCTSLQELEISGCPQLEARVGNENGADWPLVTHIPYIRIHSEYVKWEGQLQLNPKAPAPAPLVRRLKNRPRSRF